MKINIGAGKQRGVDHFCVDAEQHPQAKRPLDLLHIFKFANEGSLENPLPLADGCADEVMNFHFIEHLYNWEAIHMVKEFYRLLKPGGLVIIECPDVLKSARNLLKGQRDQMGMWGLYGDWGHKNPYMMHKHGYSPETLGQLLKSAGFKHIVVKDPKTHGRRIDRDMRIEAVK